MTEPSSSPKASQANKARRAVDRHPELVEALNAGDPAALLDLLKAAGGRVKRAGVRVIEPAEDNDGHRALKA
ncbi:MAG: hypothetical protein ACYCTI_03805 [Acidimicrobiales bacterium]